MLLTRTINYMKGSQHNRWKVMHNPCSYIFSYKIFISLSLLRLKKRSRFVIIKGNAFLQMKVMDVYF
jgi:hypothetical protein